RREARGLAVRTRPRGGLAGRGRAAARRLDHRVAAQAGGRSGQPFEIFTFIVIGESGLFIAFCGTRAIFLTRSSSLHLPKIVCLPLSQSGAVSVMKNWLPLVDGPAFAIASVPGSILSPLSVSSP